MAWAGIPGATGKEVAEFQAASPEVTDQGSGDPRVDSLGVEARELPSRSAMLVKQVKADGRRKMEGRL